MKMSTLPTQWMIFTGLVTFCKGIGMVLPSNHHHRGWNYNWNKPYEQDAGNKLEPRERSFMQNHKGPNARYSNQRSFTQNHSALLIWIWGLFAQNHNAPDTLHSNQRPSSQNHNAPDTPYSNQRPFPQNHNVPNPSINQEQRENLSPHNFWYRSSSIGNSGQTDTRNCSMKQRDPKTFDGHKVEWMDYYKYFEAVAMEWVVWHTKRQIAGDDPRTGSHEIIWGAQRWYVRRLSQIGEWTKPQIWPHERDQAYKIAFRSCTRRKNGNIMIYAQELRWLVSRAYPEMDSIFNESFVLDQFTMGMGSLEICRHVQFGHPKDINQAISLTIEFETFKTAHGSDRDRWANLGVT